MNCREVEELVQGLLDGESLGLPKADLDVHLRECTDCQELHTASQHLSEGLRHFPALRIPAGLADRIAAGVMAERRQRLWIRRGIRAAALAASLLLAVLSAYYFLRSSPLRVTDPVPLAVHEADRPEAATSTDGGIEEAGDVVVSATRLAADETLHQGRVLLPLVSPTTAVPEARVLQPVLEPSAQALLEITESVTSGLEPMATSARQAMDLFLREIPQIELPDRPGL